MNSSSSSEASRNSSGSSGSAGNCLRLVLVRGFLRLLQILDKLQVLLLVLRRDLDGLFPVCLKIRKLLVLILQHHEYKNYVSYHDEEQDNCRFVRNCHVSTKNVVDERTSVVCTCVVFFW